MDKNEKQDVDLENNEVEDKEESETSEEETKEVDPSEREKELQAENAKLNRMLKQANKKAETSESETKTEQETKSDEPDYAKLAFLEQKGVEHPDDQKIVKDEAERLKLPLTDIIQMEHIKAQLQESKDGREAKEGMPKGKGRTGQASKEDVDYYMDKPDELPEDQELAGKVVEARMKKIETSSKFSSVPFIG